LPETFYETTVIPNVHGISKDIISFLIHDQQSNVIVTISYNSHITRQMSDYDINSGWKQLRLKITIAKIRRYYKKTAHAYAHTVYPNKVTHTYTHKFHFPG